MKPKIWAAGLVISSVAQPALAADTLCSVIRRLETAAPETADDPHERRSVEFHWGFDPSPDTFFSWGCRHSNQQVARQTCTWLQAHTSPEFVMVLPQSIMWCYGYRFPPAASRDWSGMAGTITLRSRSGRRLLLDLNYRDMPRGEVAMRLAVEVEGADYEPQELPPIGPMRMD